MDRSRISRREMKFAAIFSLIVAMTSAAALGEAQIGQWALSGGHPQIVGKLSARTLANGTQLDIAQYRRGSNGLITNYTLDQTKLMHLIIVRADFREFMHVHPSLRAGHFRILVALSADQRYYAYADSAPAGIGQQVVRFTLKAGEPPSVQTTKVAASLPQVAAGPYVVHLTRTIVPKAQPLSLAVTITRHGHLASDVQPYLGAAAHVVVISTSNLSYIHVHPMARGQKMQMSDGMNGMTMPTMQPSQHVDPHLDLSLPALSQSGAYKMWLQFRGGGTLYVAPFTIVAQ
ncbi:MAG: hypothetical protein JO018_05285 [Candidatus Eremiobacteraeota bacterium]|nr:hypothetical protein [Candidatus Eremiobacteraeota bacterium]